MKLPRVSVVIPNYNYARYLPQAIDSVLSQTYRQVEIVVVDDGSTDDSEKLLESYGGRIQLIKQPNHGVASARNRGVLESTGELVAFLDADDLWLPAKLEQQVQRFLDDGELELVHCGLEEIDETGGHLRFCADGLEGWVATEMLLFQRAVILGGGSGLMVRRSSFEAIGGFDPRLSTSADWDLFYRLAVRQRVGFIPEVLLKYRIHGQNMHANVEKMEQDIFIAYAKAFDTNDPELLSIRRRCYGRIHLVLAGSYFRARQPYHFGRHALKSIMYGPGNLAHILSFPLRWRQRRVGIDASPL